MCVNVDVDIWGAMTILNEHIYLTARVRKLEGAEVGTEDSDAL